MCNIRSICLFSFKNYQKAAQNPEKRKYEFL